LLFRWGTQSFTVPLGELVKVSQNKYRTSTANDVVGPVMKAAFDLQNCTFKISVKNASGLSNSGLIQCGIKFDTVFDQIAEYTLP
jgi:hypothetical protein